MSSEVMVSVVTLVTVVTACAGVARLAPARASIRAERGWVNFMGHLRAVAGPIERHPAVPCPQTRLGAGQSQSTQVKTHPAHGGDRKSTRLNSSHSQISYAVFCLKKNNKTFLLTRFSFFTLFSRDF